MQPKLGILDFPHSPDIEQGAEEYFQFLDFWSDPL